MKTVRIFLISSFICVFLSVPFSVSFSQTTSVKVQNFLKVIQAAASLAEVRVAYENAKFTQSEFDQLKKAILSSPTLKPKVDQLYSQEKALMRPKMDQNQQTALANLQAMKTKYAQTQLQKTMTTKAVMQERIKNLTVTQANACVSDMPIIESISGAPIEPGVSFGVLGKGLGNIPGSIDVMFGGLPPYRAIILSWNGCGVEAQLTIKVTGVRASNDARVILTTADGKVTNMRTSFQPMPDCTYWYNWGEAYDTHVSTSILGTYGGYLGGGNKDWSVGNFQLKNDWFLTGRNFIYYFDEKAGKNAHAEVTYTSTLMVPNGSAQTDVHAGWNAFSWVGWDLYTYLCGPIGLPDH